MSKSALSVTEAAQAASVCRDMIYAAINSGELRSIKFGRRRLIRTEALEAWLAGLESATSEEMGFGGQVA